MNTKRLQIPSKQTFEASTLLVCASALNYSHFVSAPQQFLFFFFYLLFTGTFSTTFRLPEKAEFSAALKRDFCGFAVCDAERRDTVQVGAFNDERGRSERTGYGNQDARARANASDKTAAVTGVNHSRAERRSIPGAPKLFIFS